MKTTILCPHCHKEININEALSHDLIADFDKKLEGEKLKLEQEFATKEKLAKEKMMQRIQVDLDQKYKDEIAGLKTEMKDRVGELQTLKSNELQLRREKQVLEEQKQSLDLEVQRRMDEERKGIAEKARQQEQEANHLQMKQKDKALEDLKKQLDEMKRKVDQGSVQAQGEIQELEIEKILKEVFPFDLIEEVQKGVNGSDIIQKVRNNFGRECGTISFESKRTKNFSEKWIDKLKEDMIRAKADLGVIVTETMPSDMMHFGMRNGIWICSFHEVKGLALALREALLKIEAVKIYQSNSGDKMKLVYDYLTSNEFAQQIDVIVKTFVGMKGDLEQEKRALSKIWKNREKKIELVIQNTIDFYGSIQGLSGDQLPNIEALQLSPVDAEADYA